MTPATQIADVMQLLQGEPAVLVGSLVAAEAYGINEAHDLDLFCPSSEALMSLTQLLLSKNYTIAPRFERTWTRWREYGMGKWHTNSMRLMSPFGVETNLVYKTVGRSPLTHVSDVVNSFDFGLLAMGYDLRDGAFEDHRAALFAGRGFAPDGPLPMMPRKRANWVQGFFSKYNGLREAGRYAKYHRYGYDMSMVKDDLLTGYLEAELHWSNMFEPEHKELGKIYGHIARLIERDGIQEILDADKVLDYNDPIAKILQSLEP
jgi:hypothetical protein